MDCIKEKNRNPGFGIESMASVWVVVIKNKIHPERVIVAKSLHFSEKVDRIQGI